jgi:hypothetical protein
MQWQELCLSIKIGKRVMYKQRHSKGGFKGPRSRKRGKHSPQGELAAKHRRKLSFALSSLILAVTCGTVSTALLKILLFLSFQIFQKV